MLVTRKDLPNSRVKLTMVVNAAKFRHAFEHELEHAAHDVKVPGFRPGKAPAPKILEKVGRSRIEASAIDHAISEVYYEVMKQENLVPVAAPSIEVQKYEAVANSDADDKEAVAFTLEVDVLPQVKIDGYKNIKIKSPGEPKIESEEVEKVLEYLEKQKASLDAVAEGTVLEKGLWADIGYEGQVGGVKREDMKNEHHPLVIGEGSLIPGFEDAILGMKVGEERDISVTFPKDYHASELAGKKADFHVKLFELKKVNLPKRDNAFAKDFGHDTFAALEKAIKANLQEEKKQESRQKMEEDVLEQLLKIAKLEVPQSLIDQEIERMYKESRERLDKMNFQWETYLQQVGKTEEQVREDTRPQAEKNVKIGLALGKIMELEGISEEQGGGRAAVDRLLEIAGAK